jgi:hypothetical protein
VSKTMTMRTSPTSCIFMEVSCVSSSSSLSQFLHYCNLCPNVRLNYSRATNIKGRPKGNRCKDILHTVPSHIRMVLTKLRWKLNRLSLVKPLFVTNYKG